MKTRLTPHFSLEELTRSMTARKRGIPNEPDQAALQSLTILATEVLEPLRIHLGVPILVTSGYRSPELNEAIGGSKRSMHCYGAAADIEVPAQFLISPRELAQRALRCPEVRWGRIILEFPEDGWVHIESVHKKNYGLHGPLLIARSEGGRTVYETATTFELPTRVE